MTVQAIFSSAMILRQSILFVVFLITLIGAFHPQDANALRQCEFYITAGNIGLSEHRVASQISQNSSEAICSLESKGSIENLYNLVNNEQVIGGVIQSDIIAGVVRKQRKKLKKLAAVLPVERAVGHMIVLHDSQFQSVDDVANGVVCVGSRASGSYYTSLKVKAALDIPWVEANEPFSDCLKLLQRGSVDAVFALSAAPIDALNEKIGSVYRLLNLEGVENYPYAMIDAYNESEGQNNDVHTFSVDFIFVINKESLLNNKRVGDKLTTGLAAIISNMPTEHQDSVCNKGFSDYGMDVSNLHKRACKLGYFGDDW